MLRSRKSPTVSSGILNQASPELYAQLVDGDVLNRLIGGGGTSYDTQHRYRQRRSKPQSNRIE